MDHIGFDLHKRESQICILAEGGELIERRLRTEPQRFAEALGGRPPVQVLPESPTESEWVARCLEGVGRSGIPVAGIAYADGSVLPCLSVLTAGIREPSPTFSTFTLISLAPINCTIRTT